jgi:flagellar biosynthesis GTPase FlhF
MVFGLGSAALVAALAVLAVRWRGALARTPRRVLGSHGHRGSHKTEGGLTMSNGRRRLWGRAESHDPDVSEEPVQGTYASPPERIADYARGEDTTREPSVIAPESTDEGRVSDLAIVGAEVEAVLASAREAAARIRAAAETEATRLREEALAAANEEVADAKRAAAEERSEAERFRSEAEESAEETRSSAETAAEETRADAERQAAELVEDAQTRLAEADAEAGRKLRQIEGTARERVEQLQAARERHEARLESMLAVFRGVSSQLEELLEARGHTDEDAAPEEGFENALRLNIVRSNDD